jgi:hypothetical protein
MSLNAGVCETAVFGTLNADSCRLQPIPHPVSEEDLHIKGELRDQGRTLSVESVRSHRNFGVATPGVLCRLSSVP